MASGREENGESRRGGAPRGRISVEGEGRQRPFMRGIMIHSLMARGVDFESAYRTANRVRERFQDRSVVDKTELADAIRALLGKEVDESRPPFVPEMVVTGHGKGTPFSKGTLSQSLLAAAIEPNDAFDVARAIETELVQRGSLEITRRDLRHLAYEKLVDRLGKDVARRYLVWRKYEDPERPVIILLGGAAGVGKTTLALEVAHRLGIGRVVSTDSIRQIMRIMLSPELAPEIHGSSYDAHQGMRPDLLGDDPVIAGLRAQSATVSVGIRASLDRAISENASMVMDGVALVPGMLDLERYRERADMIFLVVALVDDEAFCDRFEARAKGSKRGTHRYVDNLDGILRIQEHFLEAADRYDIPIVDNVSFEKSVLLIIRHIAETLRKSGFFRSSEMLQGSR
jgi:2-phosphoglycerate kinase